MNMLLHEWSPSKLSSPDRGQSIFLPSATSLSIKPICPSIREELWVSVCLPALICLNHLTSITPITSILFCQNHYFWMISRFHAPEGSRHFYVRGNSWGSCFDECHTPLIQILHCTHFTQCLRFLIVKPLRRISNCPTLAPPSGCIKKGFSLWFTSSVFSLKQTLCHQNDLKHKYYIHRVAVVFTIQILKIYNKFEFCTSTEWEQVDHPWWFLCIFTLSHLMRFPRL